MVEIPYAPPSESIAVIGLACRLPGEAANPAGFWHMIRNKRSAYTDSSKRWNVNSFYHPTHPRQPSITAPGAHFLEEDPAFFDAGFFTISNQEAAALDPQQRLTLEVSYEALENAGIPLHRVSGTATSCFMGAISADWKESFARDSTDTPKYAYSGSGNEFLSNRVSWFFNLKGPSMTVNTACSSSLVGLHQACQSLRSGESEMAIAGGANFILNPDLPSHLSGQGFLAPDGRCKTFDAAGDGYGRGEGCAVVILKRMRDAIREGDSIRAVILASGVNQDGKTKSITLPCPDAQATLIRDVYASANLEMSRTDYFEAHGTGTKAGDPIEVRAIAETIGAARGEGSPVIVGSVKPNIGHTESTAGVAALVKCVLMLENQVIPANALFTRPNPDIPFAQWNVKVSSETKAWHSDSPRRASINSFGAGGTNAHVVLEEPPTLSITNGYANGHTNGHLHEHTNGHSNYRNGTTHSKYNNSSLSLSLPIDHSKIQRLFVLRSHDKEGIARQGAALCEFLQQRTLSSNEHGADADQYLSRLAYTLSERRSLLPWSSFYIASSQDSLCASLRESALSPTRALATSPRVGFIFTGQGAQWPRMGFELLSYPAFAESIQSADRHLQRQHACLWSVLDELTKTADEGSRIDDPIYAQPLSTILQVAIVELLRSWGVEPVAVTGHSSGEIAAAFAAGALSREDAWSISYAKGEVLREFASLGKDQPKGGMLATGLSETSAAEYISRAKGGKIVAACINSPSSVTLSGDAQAIEEVESLLKQDGVFARKLKVSHAYHSYHMDVLSPPFTKMMKDSCFSSPSVVSPSDEIVMYSTVSGGVIARKTLNGPDYWIRNMVSPVRFPDALGGMVRGGVDVFVEIGPHSTLKGPITQTLKEIRTEGVVRYSSVLSRGQDAISTALSCMGQLSALGVPILFRALNEPTRTDTTLPPNHKPLTDLPSYVWNHSTKLWAEPRLNKEHRFRPQPHRDLIGAPLPGISATERTWRGVFRISEEPWIEDHRIQSTVIYPAAGYIAMAIEGARQLLPHHSEEISGFRIRDLDISAAGVVQGGSLELMLALHAGVGNSLQNPKGWLEFSISSCKGDQDVQLNCRGRIKIEHHPITNSPAAEEHACFVSSASKEYKRIDKLCSSEYNEDKMYGYLDKLGYSYGPTFRNLSRSRQGEGVACASITIPDTGSTFVPPPGDSAHVIHPTTLDSIIQGIFVATTGGSNGLQAAMVPRSIEELYVSSELLRYRTGDLIEICTTAGPYGMREMTSDIHGLSPSLDKLLVHIKSLRLSQIDDSGEGNNEDENEDSTPKEMCFQTEWHPSVRRMTASQVNHWLSSFDKKNKIPQLLRYLSLEVGELKILEIGHPDAEELEPFQFAMSGASQSSPTISKAVFACPLGQVSVKRGKLDLDSFKFPCEITSVDELSVDENQPLFDIVLVHSPTNDVDETTSKTLSTFLRPRSLLFTTNMVSGELVLATPQSEIPLSVDSRPNFLIIEPPDTAPICKDFATQLEATLGTLCHSTVHRVQWSESDPLDLAGKSCIFLLELDQPFLSRLSPDNFSKLRAGILASNDVTWISATGHPAGDLVKGFSRTLRNEIAGLRFRYIRAHDSVLFCGPDDFTTLSSLCLEPETDNEDCEFQFENGRIDISRIDGIPSLNRRMHEIATGAVKSTKLGSLDATPVRLRVGQIGILNSLRFEPDDDQLYVGEMRDDEVEIQVRASGLNFRDVLTAMGEIPDPHLGREASGVVLRVGKSQEARFQPGDAICCLAPGAHKTSIRVSQDMCQVLPPGMPFAEGASLPIVYCTAYHALVDLARLEPGQSVLIHAASGGVGQAAVQIAKHLGLNIFATVGSMEKREMIQTLYGIPEDHIFHSRDLSFSQGVARMTDGRGVDCVLNSLSGDMLRESWRCVGPFGTFVEIGLKDILANSSLEMRPFGNNASFCFFNLEMMERLAPTRLAKIFNSVMDLVRKGITKPITPILPYPAAKVEDAFRLMQTGKHTGKIVLEFDHSSVVPVLQKPSIITQLDSSKTYLLVGGLGGLGRSISHLLVASGARHLCFLSRSGDSPSNYAEKLLSDLRRRGVHVQSFGCDVSIESSLAATLKRCHAEMPPIGGVIQGAMVLRDALFETMTHKQWEDALKPKVSASWNLHQLLPRDVDFFLMLSSFSGIFGNRGQANYASGCSFQDSLAHYRRSQGLRATSLDIGIMLDVGVLAENGAAGDITPWVEAYGIREQAFHALVMSAIADQGPRNEQNGSHTANDDKVAGQESITQLITGLATGDSARVTGIRPFYLDDPRFSVLSRVYLSATASHLSDPIAVLAEHPGMKLSKATSLSEGTEIVLSDIINALTTFYQTPAAEIDASRPLYKYGVDSLVAMEMRNRLVKEFRTELSLFEVLAHTPMRQLAEQVVRKSKLLRGVDSMPDLVPVKVA